MKTLKIKCTERSKVAVCQNTDEHKAVFTLMLLNNNSMLRGNKVIFWSLITMLHWE